MPKLINTIFIMKFSELECVDALKGSKLYSFVDFLTIRMNIRSKDFDPK